MFNPFYKTSLALFQSKRKETTSHNSYLEKKRPLHFNSETKFTVSLEALNGCDKIELLPLSSDFLVLSRIFNLISHEE